MGFRQFSQGMAEARFDRVRLETLLDDVSSGRIQLPDFTRACCWRDRDVILLLETVFREHPCGTVTLVETGGEATFGFRPLAGAGAQARDNRSPTRLVVDGQQRLTALFQALRSPCPVRTMGTAGRHHYRFHYFDMRRLLRGDEPPAKAIVSVTVDSDGRALDGKAPDLRNPEFQFARMLLPANQILGFTQWEKDYTAFWDAPGRDPAKVAEARRTATAFERKFVGAVSCYPVTVLTLPHTMAAEEVRDTYVRLNTRFVPLRKSERRAA